MWGFFLVSLALITVAVVYMLLVLPAKGVPLQVIAVVGVAWFTTLLVCCIVPIDVYSTLASQNPMAVEVLWDFAYWSTQLLTWALIPLYMGYVDAGEFSWSGKMSASVKTNGLFISLMVVAGVVGITTAVLTGTLSLTTLPSLGIQLSNMFGLVCVLVLLGYGLVAIPRRAWKRSFPALQLRHQLFRLGRLVEEKEEAQRLLDECRRKLDSTKQALGNSEVQAHERINGMLAYVHTFVGDGDTAGAQAGTVQQGVEYADELPKLHKEIKRDVSWVGAVRAQADMTIQKACYLTRVVKASNRESATAEAITVEAEGPWLARTWWQFDVYVRPWLLRGTALAAAVLSAVILWGEVVVGFSANLSPLSHLVKAVSNQFFSQLLVMLPLIYVIVATYTAFFAVDIGSLYMLLPHSSSSFSLLFNGTMMARFAPALCYNYLHVLDLDRPTHEGYSTVFAQRMGMGRQGDVAIPFLGTPFNRWAPVLMLFVVWLTFVNAFGKLYRWATKVIPFIPQAYDDDDGDEESESSRFVAAGQRIVNRAMHEVAQGHAISSDFLNLARYSPGPAQQQAHISRTGSKGSLSSSKSNSIGGHSTGQAPLLP